MKVTITQSSEMAFCELRHLNQRHTENTLCRREQRLERQLPAEDHRKQEEMKILPSREQAPATTLTSGLKPVQQEVSIVSVTVYSSFGNQCRLWYFLCYTIFLNLALLLVILVCSSGKEILKYSESNS